MTFLADENFPRPALLVLREAGNDVRSVAEDCPGSSDEYVADLCARDARVLLTFDKDFGELVFRRGLRAGLAIVLFRVVPESPLEVVGILRSLVETERAQGRSLLRDHPRPGADSAASARKQFIGSHAAAVVESTSLSLMVAPENICPHARSDSGL